MGEKTPTPANADRKFANAPLLQRVKLMIAPPFFLPVGFGHYFAHYFWSLRCLIGDVDVLTLFGKLDLISQVDLTCIETVDLNPLLYSDGV